MFSPEVGGPASLAVRSNPRRRQRNASEDSVVRQQPVKRRKRSGLTSDTFRPTELSKLNGHVEPAEDAPLANGHAHEPKILQGTSADSGPATRDRSKTQIEREKRSGRRDGDIELVRSNTKSEPRNTDFAIHRRRMRITSSHRCLQLQHRSIVRSGRVKPATHHCCKL